MTGPNEADKSTAEQDSKPAQVRPTTSYAKLEVLARLREISSHRTKLILLEVVRGSSSCQVSLASRVAAELRER